MNNKPITNNITKIQLDNFANSESLVLGLFGPNGSGKEYLADDLVCKKLQINSASHYPYIFRLDAELHGIEDIRELQKKLTIITPGENKVRRAVILKNVDKFGHEAQNSLLKTIEEPPVDTLIIIISSRPQSLIDTIASRLQKINVKPITLKDAIFKLNDNYTDEEITKNYYISGGRAGLMMSLLNNRSDHKVVKLIEYSKALLVKNKHLRLSEIDVILTKNNSINVEDLLDSILLLVEFSYRKNILDNKDASKSFNNLRVVTKTIDEISNGLNKKLCLTRMFLRI